MKHATALFLNKMNQQFYDVCAHSFSDTRSFPWPGWKTCMDFLRDECACAKTRIQRKDECGFAKTHEQRAGACGLSASSAQGGVQDVSAHEVAYSADFAPLAILDVAAGNLRFESFVFDKLGACAVQVCAVDSCDALARQGARAFSLELCVESTLSLDTFQDTAPQTVHFVCNDVVANILAGTPFGASGFDVAVSFGFLHHIPGFEARVRVLEELCASVCPGGLVMVSLWRLLADERLAKKAYETLNRARVQLAEKLNVDELEAGDCLLAWQENQDVFRYVHHFYDEEIDRLVDALHPRAQLVARFRADGRSGDLNEYLVFRVNA